MCFGASAIPAMQVTPFHLTPKKNGGIFSLEGWPDMIERAYLTPHGLFFSLLDPIFHADQTNYSLSWISVLLVHLPLEELPAEGWMQGNPRLVLNEHIMASGVVGVAIQGGVEIRTVVSQGCQPIGERYVVTKVDRNVVQELGGIPPLQRLESNIEGIG